jgi:phage terminase large subunit
MKVTIPYSPRPLQRQLHDNTARFAVYVCHRRFGKTVFAINKLIKAACLNKLQAPRYAYIAPLYRQAKQVAWDYLKFYTAALPQTKVNESELRVDLINGARISLYGADNPDALRGIYLDGVILDEYAQMSPLVWSEVIRPTLTD